jgi:hypothetical protein
VVVTVRLGLVAGVEDVVVVVVSVVVAGVLSVAGVEVVSVVAGGVSCASAVVGVRAMTAAIAEEPRRYRRWWYLIMPIQRLGRAPGRSCIGQQKRH